MYCRWLLRIQICSVPHVHLLRDNRWSEKESCSKKKVEKGKIWAYSVLMFKMWYRRLSEVYQTPVVHRTVVICPADTVYLCVWFPEEQLIVKPMHRYEAQSNMCRSWHILQHRQSFWASSCCLSDVTSPLLPQCWRGKCPLARAERSSSRRECWRRFMRKVRKQVINRVWG